MTFLFRPAKREGIHLMVGLIGGTGSGKTRGALRLATGLAQGGKFAVIDTENDRALHHADDFKFDHVSMSPPYRPARYLEAVKDADKAGYKVIVIDQFSSEHDGEGGLLDWHEEELTRMAGDDWKRREACNMAGWIKPKMEHKSMMQELIRFKAHLIICLRAEPKIKMEKNDKGKTIILEAGLKPICAKHFEYELTIAALLTNENPGVIERHYKKPPPSMTDIFQQGKLIDEGTGEAIAKWASPGGTKEQSPPVVDSMPNLQEVLAGLELATTEDELKAAWTNSRAGKLGTDDKMTATSAYKNKLTVIRQNMVDKEV